MKFKKGQSGNPAGKPRGAKDKRTALRALFEPHAELLVSKVVELALAGDTTALRICIDRIVPPLRSQELPAALGSLDGTLADQGRTILEAVSKGRLAPGDALTLMQAVSAQVHLIETTELEQRILELEQHREKIAATA